SARSATARSSSSRWRTASASAPASAAARPSAPDARPNHSITLLGITTRMTANLRQIALQNIACARHKLNNINFKDGHIKDLFGENVFSEAVQRERLPKPVFKALQKTIRQGAPLDPAIADAVATAMKDWAIEKGATHF